VRSKRQKIPVEVQRTAEALCSQPAFCLDDLVATNRGPRAGFRRSCVWRLATVGLPSDLNERANQIADHLIHIRRLGPEWCWLAIFLERNSWTCCPAILGVLKSGAALCPRSIPTYPRERLAAILEDAKVPCSVRDSNARWSIRSKPLERARDMPGSLFGARLGVGQSHNPKRQRS
jgi:hypothetical protein